MNNPLNDKDFLKQLDLVKNKETYIKIYNLNFDEQPLEEIEGKVTSGSINIDGASAVRRTCSLSLVAQDININNYLWSLNSKIKIMIGLKNTINDKYDDIIWFNQGIFILTSFNVSYTVNSYTISLSGQDKMCLLNGSIGGALPASIDFKQEVFDNIIYEEVDFGTKFVPELFQVVQETKRIIDTNESFDINKTYYKKVYNKYQEISLTRNSYKFGQYYIENPNRFKLLPSDMSIEDCINNHINLYFYNEETQDYEFIDLGNNKTILDNAVEYYINEDYIPLEDGELFNEEITYYIYNEDTNRFQEILLDVESFSTNEQKLYIDNFYTLSYTNFNEEESYYELINGTYEPIYLNNITYKANMYYYDEIVSFKPADAVYNKDEIYYDLSGNKIDFYENVYNTYISGKYYIKNIYEDNFILYEDEYNPTLTYYEKQVYSDKEDIPIKTIIKEAVHTYGREPYYNIIINDVDDDGLLLKEYRGEEPLYLLVNNGICENLTNSEQECYIINSNIEAKTIDLYVNLIKEELDLLKKKLNQQLITMTQYKKMRQDLILLLVTSLGAIQSTIGDDELITYNSFVDDFDKHPSQIFFITDNSDDITIYTVLKLQYGDAAGYEVTDLTYPGELISSAGEALTSILDKIKDALQSDYEYFYDIDGRFVFQRKKTYLNTSWNNIITQDNERFAISAADTSETQYTFEDNDLIISISNSVKLDNLKNDYSVWGVRKAIDEAEIPIHARFAIDKKPYAYITFPLSNYNYVTRTDNLLLENINGLDYLKQTIYVNNEYIEDVLNLNIDESEDYDLFNKIRIEPTLYQGNMYAGIYYTYIICDWREIIYQMALDYYKHNQENDFLAHIAQYNTWNVEDYYEGNQFMDYLNNNAGKLYPTGITGYEQYYTDMEAFWRELYNPEPEVNFSIIGGYYVNKEWQEVLTDYSQFNCEYYLPLDQYNKYAEMINQAILDYEQKIKDLENQKLEMLDNEGLENLINDLESNQQELEKLKQQKTQLLKSYYTQKMIAFNDPEYKKLQDKYTKLKTEQTNIIKDTEAQILDILQNEFELY